MPIVVTPSVVPPQLDPIDWSGIQAMTWTGWDGSVWDLTGRTGGVALMPGTRGLTLPPFDRFVSSSPSVSGSRWRGWRADDRSVFWPTRVYHGDGSAAWTAYDRAFWKSLRPDRTGVWEVVQLNGEARRMELRLSGDSEMALDIIPSILGFVTYPISLDGSPYWESSEPITRFFESVTPQPFFGGTGGGGFGPPFYISSGSSLTSATITNPGDVDAYPTYVITGPSTAVSVGYAGNVVQYAATIPDGQTRTIDTNPDKQTVVDQDGNDRWADLGSSAEFDAPIPPGAGVPLTLSMTGTGSVSVQITPQWFRAW